MIDVELREKYSHLPAAILNLKKYYLYILLYLSLLLELKFYSVSDHIFYILTAFLFFSFWKYIRINMTWSLLALMSLYAWAVLSYNWSVDKSATYNALFDHVLLISLAALLVALFRNISISTEILKYVIISLFLWNIKETLLHPHLVFTSQGFAGLYGHKNVAGSCFSISIIILYALGRNTLVQQISFYGLCLMLIMTISKTSIVATFTILLFIKYFQKNEIKKIVNTQVFLSSILIITLYSFFSTNNIINLLIQVIRNLSDSFLSGRGELWKTGIELLKHPIIGEGFNGHWGGGRKIIDNTYLALNNPTWFEDLRSFDGGLFELFFDLGFVGFSLFAIFVFIFLRDLDKIKRHPMIGMSIGLLLFQLVHMFTESSLLAVTQRIWFWIVFCVFYISYTPNPLMADVEKENVKKI